MTYFELTFLILLFCLFYVVFYSLLIKEKAQSLADSGLLLVRHKGLGSYFAKLMSALLRRLIQAA